MMSMTQLQYYFFDKTPPSIEERKNFLNPSNPESPYYGFIGNKRAIDKLIRIDFQALGHRNHECSDLSVALIGQSGCGKSELAHRHCSANGLPTAEISPKAIKTVNDLVANIARTCDISGLPLVDFGKRYELPSMNVFIDEVHSLVMPVMQGLLQATEHNDGKLITESNDVVNCKRVHWVIATTDRGKLFDAFDTRFSKVIVNLYTKDEIAKIVQHNNPQMDFSVCRLVAHYCGRVPREALAFAREMKMEYDMDPYESWKNIASKVAEDNEIDPYGMTFKRLAILKSLSEGPIAERRLPIVAGCKIEELEKFILPWLMADTEDQKPMITTSTRGFSLTKAGLTELNLRNIPNKGMEALAA